MLSFKVMFNNTYVGMRCKQKISEPNILENPTNMLVQIEFIYSTGDQTKGCNILDGI